ncbi:NapC/NirT family cytochrome c [Thiovibrio sp. JS02]
MAELRDFLKNLAKRIAQSRLAVTGVVVCGVTLPVLVVLTLLDVTGVARNPYFGFINYVVLAPLFVIGLLLVAVGLLLRRDGEDIGLFTYEYLREQFTLPGRFSRVRSLLFLAVGLACAVLFLVGLISYSSIRYTNSVAFCGLFCHTVMEPQYTAFRNSPHSQVSCAQCHLGTGKPWSARAKLSGIKQIVAVAFNTYSRPITAPISNLRPGREICEECHRPDKFHGDKLYVKDRFLADENNTHVQTVLLMKVGSGGYRGRKAQGIHWHVSPRNTVSYLAGDRNREVISQVRLRREDGSETVYSVAGAAADGQGPEETRVMDCIDCHNRPTHVFLTPEEALDQKLLVGLIPSTLPYIKKAGLEALRREYASNEAALAGIGDHLGAWYKEHYPKIFAARQDALRQATAGVFQAYRENVFPAMRVDWSTYRNFIGHRDNSGCFRCHDGRHTSASGETITAACDACHVILAEAEPAPDVIGLLQGAARNAQRAK